MKQYTVTIVVQVLAEDEQCAWEYGNALATRRAATVASGVQDDPNAEQASVEVTEND